MTAPRPLPPCPLCGEQPRCYWLRDAYVVECYDIDETAAHSVSAKHKEPAVARRVWRRLARPRP